MPRLAYWNNGLSMRRVPDEYAPAPGEVIFSDEWEPTTEELDAAFPGYAAAVAARDADRTFDDIIKNGLAVVSKSAPSLCAMFDISPGAEDRLVQAATRTDPGTFHGYWRDITGIKIKMSPDQFRALASAILSFIATAERTRDIRKSGGTAPWPHAPVVID